jgi:hypothetical protein
MVNCALMHVDWRTLTWWEYSAMLTVWNERHNGDASPKAITLDRNKMRAALAMVN